MERMLHTMPIVEIRESVFELDDMLSRLSSINTEHTGVNSDIAESLLCLGNEIKKIKTALEFIENQITINK